MKPLNSHCSICLSDIEKRDKKNMLPCKHTYHASCIKEWRDTHITCPVCRVEMPLTCCEKCNVCLALPSTRCFLELLRVFLFPLSVLIVIIYFIAGGRVRE